MSVLSSLPLVTDTSGGSRRRAEPASGAVANWATSTTTTGTSAAGAQASIPTSAAPASKLASTVGSSPVVPAPLGNRFQPASAPAQAPTVSAHVSAAQRRATDPLAQSARPPA